MSQLGHLRRFRRQAEFSGLPSNPDIPIARSSGGHGVRADILGRYLFERRQAAGAVPNVFLKARENAASEL
jgi:hypothetical protein